jgi:CheY-like chemotaxis protein
VKFTERGEIAVRIARVGEGDTKTRLRVTVRDTGIGIPDEKRVRLFQVFSQVDSSTTRKYGGSGLGLSISKNLAEMMNGEIGVDSVEGQGSTFWFTVELGVDPSVTQPVWNLREYNEAHREEKGIETIKHLAGMNALVVDDNSSASESTCEYMKGWGCKVDSVSSGKEALAALREGIQKGVPYDLCITDLLMPGMDGWQFASEVNADKSINGVRLFLLNPAGKSGEEAKMKLLGWFDGYLTKPVKKLHLFEALDRALNAQTDLEGVEELEPAEDEQSASRLHSSGEPAQSVSENVARSGYALVAEDHEVNQHLFKTILENIGFRVDIAANGRFAVEATEKNAYDIIFMDVQMPEMNGYEATERIRANGIDVPIVAVTASAIKGELDRCIAVGMSDVLTKPFKKRDLLPVLDKWLTHRTSVPSAADSPEPAKRSGGLPVAPIVDERTIFDYDEAVETFMGNRPVVEKVFNAYIDRVAAQIKELADASTANDMEAVRQIGHSIKGGGWNLEIKRLGDLGAEIESAGREGESDRVPVLITRLEAGLEELKGVGDKLFSGTAQRS